MVSVWCGTRVRSFAEHRCNSQVQNNKGCSGNSASILFVVFLGVSLFCFILFGLYFYLAGIDKY